MTYFANQKCVSLNENGCGSGDTKRKEREGGRERACVCVCVCVFCVYWFCVLLKPYCSQKFELRSIFASHINMNTPDWAFVVTSTQNHQIIHLFNIIEILNKFIIVDVLQKMAFIYFDHYIGQKAGAVTYFFLTKSPVFRNGCCYQILNSMLFKQEIKSL